MGLALRKSVGEVRALPYPEFRSWQIYYLLEPWGWENLEYLAGSVLAMLYNVNRGKKGKAKEPKHFMRDMEAALLKQLKEMPDIDNMPNEEKREHLIRQIKQDFGIK